MWFENTPFITIKVIIIIDEDNYVWCDFYGEQVKEKNDFLMKIIMCDVPDRISLPSAFIFASHVFFVVLWQWEWCSVGSPIYG